MRWLICQHVLYVFQTRSCTSLCGQDGVLKGSWCCQVAVLRETDAKGPFCSLIMSVVVVKDVLLFMCFAINVEFARVVRHPTH